MLPTTKDPAIAVHERETESQLNLNGPAGAAQDQRRTDAVGAEVPVIVHASRYSSTSLGVGKNLPPVHEETRTVIVFPNGAVVRVSASMAAGELVVLTNQRTGADVICKVVNVKTQPGIQNYVNLEFTQRAPGFWDANTPSEKHAGSQSSVSIPTTVPASLPTGPTAPFAPAETKSPVPQAAAAKPSLAAASAMTAPDLSFTAAPSEIAEKPHSTAAFSGSLSGNVLETDSSIAAKPRSSAGDTTEIKSWAGHRDSGSKTAKETSVSKSKKILLFAGAAVLLVSAGVAGGAWFFRSGRLGAPTIQTSANAPEQSVPLPPVTTDQEAALPSQPDTAAQPGALQPAVVASNASGESNAPSAQPTAVNASSQPFEDRPSGQTRITSTAQPAKRSSIVLEKLSAPVKKTSDAANSVEAPAVAGQINGLADSNTLATALNGEAPRPTAPVVPTHTGGQIQPAKPLTTVAPTYPLNATGRHIEGVVTIDAGLDSTGKVFSMKVLSGPPELQQAAMNALRKWRYQPAMLDGQAIESHTIVNLSFHLPKP